MKNLAFLLLFFAASLQARNVEIVSNFTVSDILCDYRYTKDAGFRITSHYYVSNELLQALQHRPIHKILVWNCVVSSSSPLFETDPGKLIYFLWEPWKLDPNYYRHFSRVYTWDDTLVDGNKFFKFYYPSLMPAEKDIPSFEEKRFCTLVASNWTAQRIAMIQFFESKPSGDFEFYGYNRYPSKMYQGPIPGFHSGKKLLYRHARF